MVGKIQWRIHGTLVYFYLLIDPIKNNHSCTDRYPSPMDPSWVFRNLPVPWKEQQVCPWKLGKILKGKDRLYHFVCLSGDFLRILLHGIHHHLISAPFNGKILGDILSNPKDLGPSFLEGFEPVWCRGVYVLKKASDLRVQWSLGKHGINKANLSYLFPLPPWEFLTQGWPKSKGNFPPPPPKKSRWWFQIFLEFSPPIWGRWTHFDLCILFQLGWFNHQLEMASKKMRRN